MADFTRRDALGILGLGAVLVRCAKASDGDRTATSPDGRVCREAATGVTAGPYPADGTNQGSDGGVIDDLVSPSIYRSDITSNIDGTGLQPGLPLDLTITLVNVNASCAPIANAAVYVWHCSRDGAYSAYRAAENGGGVDYEGDTFLRGVQVTSSEGQVTFTTIFPGRYAPRATHIHVEIYDDGTLAPSHLIATTQLPFPDDVVADVYANATGYSANKGAGATASAADGVFAAYTPSQLGAETVSMSGDTTNGYAATVTLTLAV